MFMCILCIDYVLFCVILYIILCTPYVYSVYSLYNILCIFMYYFRTVRVLFCELLLFIFCLFNY
jgi:hypothetical protein